jgi:phosphate transport system ATP-binding protein
MNAAQRLTMDAPMHVAFRERQAEERTATASAARKAKIEVQHLDAWFGASHVIKDVSIEVPEHSVLAVIGPSGCGKSTFLRCLNRMHELVPGARAEGKLLLDGQDLYAAGVDPVQLRRRVGMVFQRPNPFPTMSVRDNVAAGLVLNGIPGDHGAIVERCLRQAALWDEVKDKLHEPGSALSGGQQQRLCIARAVAAEPEILLMDEPCSALDPIATGHIEDLMRILAERYTIVIVTHNMQQAARVSSETAFMLLGDLVEFGPTTRIFENPQDQRTEEYVSGRYG